MRLFFLFCFTPLLLLCQDKKTLASQYIKTKHYAKAEALMLTYLKSNSKDKQAIELLGDAYGYQRKWDKAIKQYKLLTTMAPKNANYFYKHGGALGLKAKSISKIRALGLIGDIKSSFLKAASLDAKHLQVRWALVELYVSLPTIVGGSTLKSLKYANELEHLSKVDGYLAKGYVYEYDDKPVLAEKYYKKAVKVGGSVTCYQKLTDLYMSNNQPEKAIQTIATSQKAHNRNGLHYQLGKVSADYNLQLDKGQRCLNTYLKNYSAADGVPKEWVYYRLAQIFKHKKNKKKALIYINKALALKPDFKQAKKEKLFINTL